jgi:peptide/nickel transport system substrate-binding protein
VSNANRLAVTRRQALTSVLTGGGALAAGAVLQACGSSGSSTSSATAAAGTPKRGGNLRVGITVGSSADTLDAGKEVTNADAIRVMALYNGLVRLDPSGAHVVNDLAEELTPSADARSWTVRLRPGVTFHNGKDLTAEDVLFTLRRIANKSAPLVGATALAPIDFGASRILDKRTLRLQCSTVYSSLPEQLSDSYNFGIVPVGYNPHNPVGTGPFEFVSFSPGQRSVFARNKNYFRSGLPYVDQLTIIDISDDTAAFNAVQTGQIDVYTQATLSLAKTIPAGSQLKTVISQPGQWTPFTMRVDQPPFNDVRVRQAFRLIVDRPAMIEQALSGFGAVGNDVFSEHDPSWNGALSRHQDLPQAKSLLKQAGRSGLAVELVTAPFAAGVVEAAQVFAQQASGAGVTVKLRKLTTTDFYGPSYLKYTFAQDFWAYNPFLSQVAQGMLPLSPYNETHWNDPHYTSLYEQANATLDQSRRFELSREMQMIDFNQGGYIIPSYNKQVDIMSSRVNGVPSSGTGVPLGNASWETIWLS